VGPVAHRLARPTAPTAATALPVAALLRVGSPGLSCVGWCRRLVGLGLGLVQAAGGWGVGRLGRRRLGWLRPILVFGPVAAFGPILAVGSRALRRAVLDDAFE
jgi:hypothetical protein